MNAIFRSSRADDIATTLKSSGGDARSLSGRTERRDGDLRYAPGKWSVKEVLGHVNDTERIMSYRALRIARGDATPIEGFEQDDYVRRSTFRQRPRDGRSDCRTSSPIRNATIQLIRHLDRGRVDAAASPTRSRSVRAPSSTSLRDTNCTIDEFCEEKYLK